MLEEYSLPRYRINTFLAGMTLGDHGGPREMFTATCSSCGQPAQVPFQPSGEKPVHCSACFEQRRGVTAVAVTAGEGDTRINER